MGSKILFILVFGLLFPVSVQATTPIPLIPSEYQIIWQPGIPGGIPNYPVGVNVADYGANGNDQDDDTAAIKNAIAAVAPNTAVFIPQGTYYINSTITINKSNIAIRGEGFNKTKLIFNANSKLFEFNSKWGCSSTSWVSATGGLEKGSTSVTVSNPAQFAVGKYALIREDNDPNLYQCGYKGCETYGERAMGQVLKVKAVSGNTLTFTQPFNLTYKTTLNPLICANPMVEYTGIEDLYVEQQQSSGSGSNFHFHDTAFCWLKNVWSEKTLTAHVFFDTAFGNEIRGSVFNDSFLHNSGGQGYGIRTEAQSTANLIEDNIFNHLRHSMVVALGANGNVFGYNYSRNPYTSQSPNWLSNDIAIHGFYGYQNLFESNIVQLTLIDNVWGSNGSTTIFRNRIEKDLNSIDAQINKPETFSFIQIDDNNPYHNIIGNELGVIGASATKPINLTSSVATSTLEACNFSIQTQMLWRATNCTLPPSLYYTQKPAFLGNSPWPLLGGDISPNSNILPAQQRYRNGTYVPSTPTPPACIPNCTGKACGDDGCGSSCGSCAINYSCTNSQCVVPTPTPTRTPTPVPPTPTRTPTPTPTKTPTPIPPTPTRTLTPILPTPTRTPTPIFPTLTPFLSTPTPTPTASGGKTYYVSKTGNNSNGLSWTAAWNELNQINWGIIQPGDTIEIDGGSSSKTYSGTLTVPAGTSGITITKGKDSGHNGEVIFDGQGSAVGIKINATSFPVSNVLISNLTLKNYSQGISGDGGGSGGLQGITIDNCKIVDFKRAGVFIDGYGNLSGNKNIVVKNSYFDDDNAYTSQSDGIYVQVVTDFTADHNIIILDNNYTGTADLHSDNIQSYYVKNVTYSNNIVIQKHNKTLGTQMLFTEEASTLENNGVHTVVNNVFIRDCPNAQDAAIRLKTGKGTVFTAHVIGNTYYGRAGRILNSSVASIIKNNIFYSIGSADIVYSGSEVSNNIISTENGINPNFVATNFTNPDFHLQSGSPALNAGVNLASLGSIFATDIEGKTRATNWDIGAYEYTGVSCIPNCTNKACGSDGCGSSCGSCAINYSCTNFQCVAPTPTPVPPTPTKTLTPIPPTPTRTPTPIPPTLTNTPTPTRTPTPTPTRTPTPIPPTPTKTPTPISPTLTVIPTITSNPTTAPTITPEPTATVVPTIPVCIPSCTNKACGDDGCNSSCGSCQVSEVCKTDFTCGTGEVPSPTLTPIDTPIPTDIPTDTVPTITPEPTIPVCIPSCTNKACGDDGCNSSCGSCSVNESCNNFQCNISSPTSTVVPTQSAGNVNLNMKLKFQGINKLPPSGENSMTVNIKIYKEGETDSNDGNGVFVADANGVWAGTIKVNIETLSGKYRILIKGNQHIQKKICDSTPTETSPGIYQCSTGTITLTAGDNELNLSGIILLAGDLDQSSIVDSVDFGLVRNNLGRKDAATLAKSDINRDGIVDTQDFSLIIAALRIRTDEQ